MRRKIELLAPAANADIAIEAILHGADAIYIGPPSHGARKSASNSFEDIKRVVDFAHPFGVRVYATVNTIVYGHELKSVENLIRDLYRIGVDAIIVQDMGILRLDLPPIALHASTQCDTRTPKKARFLQDAGFSQIVLARELTLGEIHNICSEVSVPVECFVHGALCVSYSGRCHASQSVCGRSANRGECAQICRLPFTLTDADGKILSRQKHLLSLKDFNASASLEDMLEAGVSSFKIEGRLKDAAYVKNIVAYYRQLVDEIISRNPNLYERSSAGSSEVSFIPAPEKSFNRGFTTYFLNQRRQNGISSPLTPKSMGEEISDPNMLHNGDGVSFFNEAGEYVGILVNGVRNGRIIANKPFKLPKGATLHRTLDVQMQKELARPTARRRMNLDVDITRNSIFARNERGVEARVRYDFDIEPAQKPRDLRSVFDKFGNTIYRLGKFSIEAPTESLDPAEHKPEECKPEEYKSAECKPETAIFIPPSQLAEARRMILEVLERASKASYSFDKRLPEKKDAIYPDETLDYRDNVANGLAREFYLSHRVRTIEPALEVEMRKGTTTARTMRKERTVMTTRHCILREMGKCLKETPEAKRDFKLPLSLSSGPNRFQLRFDCRHCEMNVVLNP